ncbi:hypothetical protein QYE76_042034 [Lolium multiflorum]|uniref:Retrotransposon gag domain-containing protein n=1 Tax=Lolium multiflorum TaxID=4521 RepID=A0AAD8TEX0_LOLMU|nr:hypothetical protein QYE76_042034 [Lolium multiflorum]
MKMTIIINNLATIMRIKRMQDHYIEEIFGKLKFTMPKFQGEEDPEAYLSWVRKVEKIFRIHNYSNAKKVPMTSSEFEDYASVRWDELNDKREANLLEPIETWEEMKEVMHTRFVPSHHKRDLFNKLTQLKQSFKSVEEYYKEMHMTMMSANVDEREEQTMARFLNGLNIPVKRIVELLPYTNMVELLHQATRAEYQKSYTEIFSELTKQKPTVLFSAEGSRAPKERRRGAKGAQPTRRCGQGAGAPPWGGPLERPPTLPFLLYNLSVAKTLVPRATIREKLLRRRRRQSHLGDSEIASGTLPERGILTGGLYITMPASGVMRE